MSRVPLSVTLFSVYVFFFFFAFFGLQKGRKQRHYLFKILLLIVRYLSHIETQGQLSFVQHIRNTTHFTVTILIHAESTHQVMDPLRFSILEPILLM